MLLIGYFNTLDKVKYGIDKRKRVYYGFTPFYGNIRKIKIAYSGKQKGKLLAQVFINENNLTDFPSGQIVNIIGKYSNENLMKLLKTDSEHKFKKNIINYKKNKLEKYCHKFISIDPKGSIDIDDGFSVNFPYLDIIIASPILYLDNEDIMSQCYQAVSSRYSYITEHLWGEDINNKSSLLQNNETDFLVLKYHLNNKTFQVKFMTGKNNHQLSYDFVDEIIESKNKEYQFIIEWFNVLQQYFNFTNSKELVQEIMILANKKFTEYCVKNNLPILYRQFKISHDFDNLELDENIKTVFNQRKSESAFYTLEKQQQELMSGLYSHFTSPLRRWVDSYHHLILYLFFNNKFDYIEKLKNILDVKKINYKFSKIKKFHREYNYLLNNKLINKSLYQGYLFNVKKNYLLIWCPEINRFIKVEFKPIELLFQIELSFTNNVWLIFDKINNEKYSFKLGQIINFTIENTNKLIPSQKIKGLYKKN